MRRQSLGFALVTAWGALIAVSAGAETAYFDVAKGAGPHDVAAAPGPGAPVYYTAQRTGKLGILDPKSAKFEEIPLGRGSAPHGVIVGPDGAPWITDGGQNAIVRVDPATREVKVFPLPKETGYANLNTLTFDRKGRVWFTGQSGYYGRVDHRFEQLRDDVLRVHQAREMELHEARVAADVGDHEQRGLNGHGVSGVGFHGPYGAVPSADAATRIIETATGVTPLPPLIARPPGLHC